MIYSGVPLWSYVYIIYRLCSGVLRCTQVVLRVSIYHTHVLFPSGILRTTHDHSSPLGMHRLHGCYASHAYLCGPKWHTCCTYAVIVPTVYLWYTPIGPFVDICGHGGDPRSIQFIFIYSQAHMRQDLDPSGPQKTTRE